MFFCVDIWAKQQQQGNVALFPSPSRPMAPPQSTSQHFIINRTQVGQQQLRKAKK